MTFGTLDVVIGLVFVYVLLSLACTTLNEFVAQWWNSRADTLGDGIRQLFTGVSAPLPTVAAARQALEGSAGPQCQALAAAEKQQCDVEAEHTRLQAVVAQARTEHQAAAERFAQAAGNPDPAVRDAASRSAHETQRVLERAAQEQAGHAALVAQAERGVRAADDALRMAGGQAYTRWAQARAVAAPDGCPDAVALAGRFFAHPLIAALAQPRRLPLRPATKEETASYVPAPTFAAVFLDVVAPQATTRAELQAAAQSLPDTLRLPLLVFLRESDAQPDDGLKAVRARLERWYEDVMVRVSGLYKRKSQVRLLALATLLTVGANADTVAMARQLGNSAALRAALVAQAQEFTRRPPAGLDAQSGGLAPSPAPSNSPAPDSGARNGAVPKPNPPLPPTSSNLTSPAALSVVPLVVTSLATSTDSTPPHGTRGAGTPPGSAGPTEARRLIDSIGTLGVPLGYPPMADSTRAVVAAATTTWDRALGLRLRHYLGDRTVAGALLGWGITVLAISLGAPFWFDVLNKVVNIRSAGRAPEEMQVSPRKRPVPQP